jgi:copper chaperone CopZ
MFPLRATPKRLFIEPRASVKEIRRVGNVEQVSLEIEGLVCSVCAGNIRRRLMAVPGVRNVSVDLDSGVARVIGEPRHGRDPALVAAAERAIVLRPLRRFVATLASHRLKRAVA